MNSDIYIGVVFCFFTVVAILPVLFSRSAQGDRVFLFLSWMTFSLSTIAFFFMIGVYGVAKSRFEKRGFSASYGNLVRRVYFAESAMQLTWPLLALDVPFCIPSAADHFSSSVFLWCNTEDSHKER
jgi:bacteriorhodopsin